MWAIRAASAPLPRHASPRVRTGAFINKATSATVPPCSKWFTTEADGKLVKRKVAMVVGYLGTGYHGVQLNKNVPTIENEIRQAIFSVGAMRESNFVDLSKIDWGRSSRTDKGVHAGCIVFSSKLLIDDDKAVDAETGRIPSLTRALNDALPPTIRVFSSTRVNKRFNARKNCVLREYEYFMPLSFLKSSFLALPGRSESDWNEDQAVDAFCRALRRYDGIHDFHNFTRSRSFFYKEHARFRQRKESQDAVEADNESSGQRQELEDGNTSDDGEDDEEEAGDDGSFTTAEYSDPASQYADAEATSRKRLPRHRRSIYSCSGSLVREFHNEPFLRVHIVGQAFLLHQIRCMVGGAVAYATDAMSDIEFAAAIDTDHVVSVPIAPAEGLVLLSSTFGGKLHSVSLYKDQNTPLAKETRGVTHRILLNAEEDDAMRRFREDVIYKEVVRAWNSMDNVDRWQAYLARSHESNQKLDHKDLLSKLDSVKQQEHEQKQRRREFVNRNRTGENKDNTPRGVLPRQFTTNLCVRYAVAPGIFTSDVQRAIARHLHFGNIPADANEDQLFQFIDRYGVSKLAEEGRNLRMNLTASGKPRQKPVFDGTKP